jgi:hypothetical protein
MVHSAVDDFRIARRLHRGARAASRAQLRAEIAEARAERRREKARRALPRRGLLALGAGALSFLFADVDVPFDDELQALTGGISVYAALFAVRSFSILYGADRVPMQPEPQPQPQPLPAPPARDSVAFGHVVRLERVREELRRLLPLVAPAGRAAAEEAWEAAAEADLALRWQAARVAAVEPHGGVHADLLQALEEGVTCQERLVAVVADLVAASADPLATWRLQEATDTLHGLAQGLRELR